MDIVEVITAAIKTLVADPSRLGISWTMKNGTVLTSSPLQVVFDGDTVAIPVNSMVGSIAAGARVYVISLPPAGNYVCGFVGDFQLNGATQGLTAFAASSSNSATVSAETAVLTTGVAIFQNGGAYRMSVESELSTSAISRIGSNIRKGSTAAGSLWATFSILFPSASQQHLSCSCIVVNSSGADIATTVSQTLVASTGSVTQIGTAATVRTLVIEPVGVASDFPGAFSIS